MVCFVIVVGRNHTGGLVKTHCWAPSSEPLLAPNGWGLGLCVLTRSLGDAFAASLHVINTMRTTGLLE